jgi:hypothetical protein
MRLKYVSSLSGYFPDHSEQGRDYITQPSDATGYHANRPCAENARSVHIVQEEC